MAKFSIEGYIPRVDIEGRRRTSEQPSDPDLAQYRRDPTVVSCALVTVLNVGMIMAKLADGKAGTKSSATKYGEGWLIIMF